MSLEDIPEMELLISKFNEVELVQLEFNDNLQYSVKFVEVNHNTSSKNYFFAVGNVLSHEQVSKYFIERAELKYYISNWKGNDFKATGGGRIEIRENKIKIFSNSVRYGKYHLEIVRPIAERYFSMNMPEAELLFE